MEYPKRTGNRLTNYNYEQDGAYFITVCVKDRRRILCDIVGTSVPDCPKIQLYKYGEIADRYINQMNNFYNEISVDSYIIMPDHIHFILCVKNGQSGRLVPTVYDNKNSTVARFVGTFKRFSKTRIVVLDIAVSEEQYQAISRRIQTMLMLKKFYHYNYLGLWLAGLRICYRRKRCFYCSEFVKDLLEKQNIKGARQLSSIVQPIHFLKLPTARRIYTGRLADFRCA